MKTLIGQSYRTHDVPEWIGRCLRSVEAWADGRGYDRWLTDNSAFSLCGEAYLARVGDNKRSITNLCRLELLRQAHAAGYERAIWMDADIFVFDPAGLDFPMFDQLAMPRETWLEQVADRWTFSKTLNNCVIVARAGDPDLDFLIQTVRHRAMHHPVRHNFEVGVDVVRALHHILNFDLIPDVGMFSHDIVAALADNRVEILRHQAQQHGAPVHAANLSSPDHLSELTGDISARAMDALERTRGGVINDHLAG